MATIEDIYFPYLIPAELKGIYSSSATQKPHCSRSTTLKGHANPAMVRMIGLKEYHFFAGPDNSFTLTDAGEIACHPAVKASPLKGELQSHAVTHGTERRRGDHRVP